MSLVSEWSSELDHVGFKIFWELKIFSIKISNSVNWSVANPIFWSYWESQLHIISLWVHFKLLIGPESGQNLTGLKIMSHHLWIISNVVCFLKLFMVFRCTALVVSKLSKTLQSSKYGKYDLIWIRSELIKILISLYYKK